MNLFRVIGLLRSKLRISCQIQRTDTMFLFWGDCFEPRVVFTLNVLTLTFFIQYFFIISLFMYTHACIISAALNIVFNRYLYPSQKLSLINRTLRVNQRSRTLSWDLYFRFTLPCGKATDITIIISLLC